MYGCFQNAHLHNPGPWNGGFRHPLALAETSVGTGLAVPICVAARFPPSSAGSGALSLVCVRVYLPWKRHASASRCADLPCQSGTLSLGAQSDVPGGSCDGDRASHPLSLVLAGRICSAGMGSGSSVCRLRGGTLSAPPVWREL